MNSRMHGFERDALVTVWQSKLLWLIHVVANAALMIAFFYWLRIPEESGLQLALAAGDGLLIAFATLWLHAATLDYFRPPEHRLRQSLRRSVACVPAFLVWTAIFGLGLWLIGQLWIYDQQAGGWIHHLLPGFLRKIVTPRSAMAVTSWLIWFLFYFLWPIVLLPVGAQVAANNFRGFYARAAFRPLRELRFWIVYFICFVIGGYVPFELIWMTPTKPSPLDQQKMSMAIRFGVAYLLLVTAWLILCAAIMRASDGDGSITGELKSEPVPTAPVP
jgi:hypothetical protein